MSTIPSFKELEIGTIFLFNAFTFSKAQYEAMDDAWDDFISKTIKIFLAFQWLFWLPTSMTS
jgi:hypothetical protein